MHIRKTGCPTNSIIFSVINDPIITVLPPRGEGGESSQGLPVAFQGQMNGRRGEMVWRKWPLRVPFALFLLFSPQNPDPPVAPPLLFVCSTGNYCLRPEINQLTAWESFCTGYMVGTLCSSLVCSVCLSSNPQLLQGLLIHVNTVDKKPEDTKALLVMGHFIPTCLCVPPAR